MPRQTPAENPTDYPVTLSVVSPVYRAEDLVELLVDRIRGALDPLGLSYEIILVEDGSKDRSWLKIQQAAARYPEVRGIRLARNFGQHPAILAGLDASRGEWTVVMDCDLQDRPEEIAGFLEIARSQGAPIVFAQRSIREHAWHKRLASRSFYAVLSYLTGMPQDHSIANFGLYYRNVIDAVRLLREPTWYFPTMVRWTGFPAVSHPVKHDKRAAGETTYNWSRLFRLALNTILAFSDKPLRLTVQFGLLLSTLAFLTGLATLASALAGKITVEGWASLMISVWFLGGAVILVLGVVGLYVGRTFDQAKDRPIYITGERTPQSHPARNPSKPGSDASHPHP
jgi:dolichol-phosphate mannosyltransferase